MSHDLIATPAECRNKFGTMLVAFGVEQHREGKPGFFEQFDEPPAANPVAILAPGPIIGIGMAEPRRHCKAQTFAVGEMLDTEREINRKPFVLRPVELWSPDDRRIIEPAMGTQHGTSTSSGMIRCRSGDVAKVYVLQI